MDTLEASKRKLEEDAEVAEQSAGDVVAKRAAAADAEAVKPAPMSQPLVKLEDFSAELLAVYYDRLFPFLQMFRWLSYRNDPKGGNGEKDYFLRREFTFVLQGDIYCRYMCFRDVDEYRSQVLARQPVRMEIGAVYTHPPKNHNSVIKDAYKPVERELVFDIDMDDYDDIRTCCTGAKLCNLCWNFMKAAIKVLDRVLREDFGFNHILFVYSGRRGVHCWVCDKVARRLSNEQRSALVEYINLVTPGTNRARADLRMNGCEDLHPSVQEAYRICEGYFRDDPNGVLQGQDILRKGPHFDNIMETLSVSEREEISKYCKEKPDATSYQIWMQLEKLATARSQAAASFRQKADAKLMLKDIIIQFTCPRLDINVSKQMNHLLKSPFVVHPKTGRVCVPIDQTQADHFNPMEVPTIGSLVAELNQSGDVRQTSLRNFTHFFEVGFLKALEAESLKDLRDKGSLEF
eukprot:CAMPEP_0170597274 /NCGR_PEP_ID=MMETSP0224-20130122/15623_1 /TAXON_ID=285029 /ORGANISM="Togula jolla, Strain CCCM 725" /LENGTH=461 /DNA_ID=CAMNT_0010921741 /DNA_START=77 /DNA_END=1462 /DNA_ORIENTATION=+